MKQKQIKNCIVCQKEYEKPYFESQKAWKVRHKFCSKVCKITYQFGKKLPNSGFRSEHIPWNRGMKGIHLNPKNEFKKGELSPFWKGGVTPIHRIIRGSIEYKLWREAIYKRDNYTCVDCGIKSGCGKTVILNADHIKPFAYFPELRFAIDNGRTLCLDCHKKTDTYLNKGRWIKLSIVA